MKNNTALDSSLSSPSVSWSNLLAHRARGRLTTITQAVRSNATIAGAFETLVARGLVPEDWLDAPLNRRAFAPLSLCGQCEGGWRRSPYHYNRRVPPLERCIACNLSADSCARAALPPSLDDLVTLALDPQSIETAERLAVELFARVPDVDEGRPRILWRFVETDGASSLMRQWTRNSSGYNAFDELGCLSNDVCEPVERARVARGEAQWRWSLPTWLATAPERARADLRCAAILRAAQQLRHRVIVRETDEDERSSLITAFAEEVREDVAWAIASGCDDLATLALGRNPFEPALALWQLGIGVQAVTTRTVVLVLPSVRE